MVQVILSCIEVMIVFSTVKASETIILKCKLSVIIMYCHLLFLYYLCHFMEELHLFRQVFILPFFEIAFSSHESSEYPLDESACIENGLVMPFDF